MNTTQLCAVERRFCASQLGRVSEAAESDSNHGKTKLLVTHMAVRQRRTLVQQEHTLPTILTQVSASL